MPFTESPRTELDQEMVLIRYREGLEKIQRRSDGFENIQRRSRRYPAKVLKKMAGRLFSSNAETKLEQ